MQITVYSGFSKRNNSTKQPTGGTVLTNVQLKDPVSLKTPTFICNTTANDINYLYAFGEYYWVDLKRLDSNRTEMVCKKDLGATYKTAIGGYTGLIDFCSNSSEIMITDPRNVPTGNIANSHISASLDFTTDTTGCYIVGVAAKAGIKNGTTTWYAMSKAGLLDICDQIYDSSLWQQMWNQFNGVQNAILSAFWVPFSLSYVSSYFSGGLAGNFYIGDEIIAAQDCYNIGNRIHTGATVTITASYPFSFGGVNVPNYVYKAPYCTATLYLPFVGLIEAPVDILADNPKLTIDYQIDILTGDIIYYVHGDQAGLIGTYTGNFASKIPVAGASYDGIGVIRGIATSVIGVAGAAFNPAVGLGAAFGGINSVANSLRLTSQTNGGISSALGGLKYDDILLDIHIALPAEPNLTAYQAAHGMPYFKVGTVSACGGYVQCHNASVSIPGDGEEQAAVNAMLNSGIYYE